ncbi:insulin-like growth factor-binding protein 1 [Saccopteryx leptura]|uniref:insulin-like growth factor-binding protein 1 n=1 Tax=Saccopteryx leptura TaxID=249018 RepID=UPI00339BDC70
MLAVSTAPTWPLLLLLAVQLGAAAGAPQLWQCAPCSAETVALCPPVPASCPEISTSARCGCCPMCALQLGAACGMSTARCARGLTCQALPGESRPLQALLRGQGTCRPESDVALSDEATDAQEPMTSGNMSPKSEEVTQGQSGEDLPLLWNAISNYESIKALDLSDIKNRKGPCQRELYEVLERLAREQETAGDGPYKFYLPNCHKNGFYHHKQCETSLDGELGLCWCVNPLTGLKISGSPEARGDLNCHRSFL